LANLGEESFRLRALVAGLSGDTICLKGDIPACHRNCDSIWSCDWEVTSSPEQALDQQESVMKVTPSGCSSFTWTSDPSQKSKVVTETNAEIGAARSDLQLINDEHEEVATPVPNAQQSDQPTNESMKEDIRSHLAEVPERIA
jgi:hypothetical protein